MEPEKIIRAAKFVEETVPLDGTEFYECTFTKCTLTFSGDAVFILAGCTLVESHFNLIGAARTTCEQLSAMHNFGYSGWVERLFERIRNPFPGSIQ